MTKNTNQINESVYTEEGFKNRKDYLQSLAQEYGTTYDVVISLASVLGPEEDFDALPIELEDMMYQNAPEEDDYEEPKQFSLTSYYDRMCRGIEDSIELNWGDQPEPDEWIWEKCSQGNYVTVKDWESGETRRYRPVEEGDEDVNDLREGYVDKTDAKYVNIRESLNLLDRRAIDEGTKYYDLRNMYEAAKLTADDRVKLKELISTNNDPEVISAYLDKKVREEFEDVEAPSNVPLPMHNRHLKMKDMDSSIDDYDADFRLDDDKKDVDKFIKRHTFKMQKNEALEDNYFDVIAVVDRNNDVIDQGFNTKEEATRYIKKHNCKGCKPAVLTFYTEDDESFEIVDIKPCENCNEAVDDDTFWKTDDRGVQRYGINGKWWYFTTHGVQPGSIPKGVNVLEVRDGKKPNGTRGTFVAIDRVLNTDELNRYDLIELSPNTNEAYSHFEYTSGANPYIAKNEKERDRLLKKYGKKATKVKDGFYRVDDEKQKHPFELGEDYTDSKDEWGTPTTQRQAEKDLKELTNDFTDEKGNISCDSEEEKYRALKILRRYYKVVEASEADRTDKNEMQWVITYSNPLDKKKQMKEALEDDEEYTEADAKFNDKYFPRVDVNNKSRYDFRKHGKNAFAYDKEEALLIYVFKDPFEEKALGKATPWRELDAQGLSRDEWKESADYWMDVYSEEIAEEGQALADDFMKYEYPNLVKEEFTTTPKCLDEGKESEDKPFTYKELWNEMLPHTDHFTKDGECVVTIAQEAPLMNKLLKRYYNKVKMVEDKSKYGTEYRFTYSDSKKGKKNS